MPHDSVCNRADQSSLLLPVPSPRSIHQLPEGGSKQKTGNGGAESLQTKGINPGES